jgi:hypothetical protein
MVGPSPRRSGFGRAGGTSPAMTNSFVDGIFTTSIQSAFTKTFAVKAQTYAIACLCRAGNAD